MTMSITMKGVRALALIRALRAAGSMAPGAQLPMPHERPATYVGPAGGDMHTFRLSDGTEVVLEVAAQEVEAGEALPVVSSGPVCVRLEDEAARNAV